MPATQRGEALRKGRYSGAGQIYLLTSVVQGRRPLFADCQVGRFVVKQFQIAQQEGRANTLAWVVMPDHFHWLVELKAESLGTLMRKVKAGSALSIMRAMQAPAKVWQKGYHDRAVRREEDLQSIARYIVANPLRAGLVKRIGDYPL
ncbi:REP-associated tyrosine transposase [Pseudomonas huanghezhanensis]|uniref:REP-associated tyrosine transposase n=1 Tax=Pseudomonas huanghezhanensis TaxID=3002903 RepID=UPI002285F482|nr:transposase [Pseudomonas sp. BSw22131]